MSRYKTFTRANRRPFVFAGFSAACLIAHHALLRAMAHGHVAHVLLASGSSASSRDVTLAVALVVVRFVTIVVVPGLLLAAAAELLAYLLVGPKRDTPTQG